MDIDKRLEQVLAQAERLGDEQKYYFLTTLERYQEQLGLLQDLKDDISAEGRYVKLANGSMKIHPAVTELNKTASAANNTLNTLLGILKQVKASTLSEAVMRTDDDEL